MPTAWAKNPESAFAARKSPFSTDHKNLLEHLEKLDPGVVLFDNDSRIFQINQALMVIIRDVFRERFLAGT